MAWLTGEAFTAPAASERDALLAWLDESPVPASLEVSATSALIHETCAPSPLSLADAATTTASVVTTLPLVGTFVL